MKSFRLCAALILSAMTATSVRLVAQANPPPALAAEPAAPAPIIKAEKPDYDFGRVAVGEKVRHTYVIANAGDAMLHVTRVQPSCHCTTAGKWTEFIAPGKSGEITVQFDSTGYGYGGQVTKTIMVYSDAKNEPRMTLMLHGTVWKPIEVTPSTAIINVPPDSSDEITATVRIVNQTDHPVTFSHAVSANHLFKAALKEVIPGKEYSLIITARPPYTPGSSWGTVTVSTSLTNTPTINVPVMSSVVLPIQIYPGQIVLNLVPNHWTTNRIVIRGTTTNILSLSNPKANESRIHVDLVPMGARGMFSLLVSFPPDFQLEPGQRAEVTLNSNQPRQPVITIPIMQFPRPRKVAQWPVPSNPAPTPATALTAHPTPPQAAGHP